jgi:hypothetical protein
MEDCVGDENLERLKAIEVSDFRLFIRLLAVSKLLKSSSFTI